jgi:uncharacterized protein YceK
MLRNVSRCVIGMMLAVLLSGCGSDVSTNEPGVPDRSAPPKEGFQSSQYKTQQRAVKSE